MSSARRVAAPILALLLASCRETKGDPAGRASAACSELTAAVLAGRPLDAARANLWQAARPVYECRMIESDDAAICDLFPAAYRDNCLARYAFWHGARVRAPESNWEQLMADGIAADCKNPMTGVPRAQCDQLVGAIRAGDPARCHGLAGMPGLLCRGVAGANPGACAGNADCEELATRLVLLRSGGLERVAREATQVDRSDALAVLGRANPCAPLGERLRAACVAEQLGTR